LFHCAALSDVERRIKKFTFWRDRLVLLKKRFDEGAEPVKTTLGMVLEAVSAESAWSH